MATTHSCPFVFPSMYLSIPTSIHFYICLYNLTSIHPPRHIYMYQFIVCLSTHSHAHPSRNASIRFPICPPSLHPCKHASIHFPSSTYTHTSIHTSSHTYTDLPHPSLCPYLHQVSTQLSTSIYLFTFFPAIYPSTLHPSIHLLTYTSSTLEPRV